MASKKSNVEDERLTAASVEELLEAPDRERRRAEAAAATEAQQAAQWRLAEALQQRLAVLEPIGAEAAGWFAHRPTVTTAVFEEIVGGHARELIDRVVTLGGELLESAGPSAQAAAQQWVKRLTQPMSSEAFEAALTTLKDMEQKESTVVHRAAAWRALRTRTAAQLRSAIAMTEQQIAWLDGAQHG
jgi:hypothetical protein